MWAAVRHGDVDTFVRVRKRVMAVLAIAILQQEANVYKHDPDALGFSPHLSLAAPDDNIKGLFEEEHQPPSEYDADEALDEDTDAYGNSEASRDSDELNDDEEDSEDLDDSDDLWDDDDGQCDCPSCRDGSTFLRAFGGGHSRCYLRKTARSKSYKRHGPS